VSINARKSAYAVRLLTDEQCPKAERSALCRILNGMKERCHNPNCNNYYRYGGRGIRVCDRWREASVNFILDMGPRPTPKHTIERIDNDGHYEPGNCKWATAAEQRQNQAYTLYVLHDGRAVKMSDYRTIAAIGTKAIFAGFKDGTIPECCRRGHLYSTDNTQWYDGQRWCKTCRRASERRSWEKRRPNETAYKRARRERLRAEALS
jgi:hypothetical protein